MSRMVRWTSRVFVAALVAAPCGCGDSKFADKWDSATDRFKGEVNEKADEVDESVDQMNEDLEADAAADESMGS